MQVAYAMSYVEDYMHTPLYSILINHVGKQIKRPSVKISVSLCETWRNFFITSIYRTPINKTNLNNLQVEQRGT